MTTRKAWIAGALLVVGITGCRPASAAALSSPTPKPNATPISTPSAANTIAEFGAAYLLDTHAVDVAASTLYKQLDAFAGMHPTMGVVESDMAPYASAIGTLDDTLRNYTLPPRLETDVRALVTSDQTVLSDIAGIGAATNFNAWEHGFVKDDTESASASAVVNADLGLPSS